MKPDSHNDEDIYVLVFLTFSIYLENENQQRRTNAGPGNTDRVQTDRWDWGAQGAIWQTVVHCSHLPPGSWQVDEWPHAGGQRRGCGGGGQSYQHIDHSTLWLQ